MLRDNFYSIHECQEHGVILVKLTKGDDGGIVQDGHSPGDKRLGMGSGRANRGGRGGTPDNHAMSSWRVKNEQELKKSILDGF